MGRSALRHRASRFTAVVTLALGAAWPHPAKASFIDLAYDGVIEYLGSEFTVTVTAAGDVDPTTGWAIGGPEILIDLWIHPDLGVVSYQADTATSLSQPWEIASDQGCSRFDPPCRIFHQFDTSFGNNIGISTTNALTASLTFRVDDLLCDLWTDPTLCSDEIDWTGIELTDLVHLDPSTVEFFGYVPEPSSGLLVVGGLIALTGARGRRRRCVSASDLASASTVSQP